MPTNKYTTYYNYLAKNWTKKLANHIVKHELKGELHYDIDTTGIDDLKKLKKSGIDTDNASIYMPAPYDVLEELFEKVSINKATHVLDVGCGKGRAMVVAAYMGAKKISGVDFSAAFCIIAQDNRNRMLQKFPKTKVKVHHNDAFYFAIEKDVDIIFMFNPFNDIIMSGVLENIEKSIAKKPRKITIIYINPICKKLLVSYGYTEKFSVTKMRYLSASIFEK